MAKKSDGLSNLSGLRRKAEARLRTTRGDVAAMPVQEVQRLVQELQVHQIELEMQNQELRRTQLELEAAHDRYVDLYDSAPVGYLTVDPKGMILDANLPACTLLGSHRKTLLGQPVVRFVAAKDQATWLQHLRGVFDSGAGHVCEVDLARQADVPVSIQFESVAVSGEAESAPRLFTAVLDITDRRRAAAHERLQRLERERRLEERVWIGHDLHDGILQSLYAIGLGLEAGKRYLPEAPGKVTAALAHSIGELESVMREVRSFIGGLEKAGLEEIDLPASLRSLAETLGQLYGQRIRVSIDPAGAAGLSQVQSLQIVNLVKEALSNSCRHARATVVQASLRQLKDGIRVTVRDNGTGFKQKGAARGGQGFASMKARAGRLGGTLSVQSSPAQGTRVVLDLPRTNGLKGVAS